MKKIKNMLLATAAVCFFSTIINLIYFIDGISKPQNAIVIFVIYYVLAIVASAACGVLFLVLYKKPNNAFAGYLNVFKTLCVISIFCSLLAGILAFYTYYLYIAELKACSKNTQENCIEVDGMEIIENKRMAKYIDELNRLEEMKQSGIISQEQYEILKNKTINKYLKGE